MRKNERAGVIIIKDNKVLLINRTKDTSNYYIVPGGGVEENETPIVAAIREIREELGIEVKIEKEIPSFENRGNVEYYFLSNKFSGNLTFIGDTNESNKIIDKVEWVEFLDLKEKTIFPDQIKKMLIDTYTK